MELIAAARAAHHDVPLSAGNADLLVAAGAFINVIIFEKRPRNLSLSWRNFWFSSYLFDIFLENILQYRITKRASVISPEKGILIKRPRMMTAISTPDKNLDRLSTPYLPCINLENRYLKSLSICLVTFLFYTMVDQFKYKFTYIRTLL